MRVVNDCFVVPNFAHNHVGEVAPTASRAIVIQFECLGACGIIAIYGFFGLVRMLTCKGHILQEFQC